MEARAAAIARSVRKGSVRTQRELVEGYPVNTDDMATLIAHVTRTIKRCR
ncbi:MAG: hypothetical protein M3256_18310 [Actinomycetota bacterium]|nr:hypothetical protein [Actinomycetota bacterium]